jgi:phosphonoacetaldehyde hydrolase
MSQDMSERCRHLKAIVFDWAGTTIDHGSRAPAAVFQRIFQDKGIEVSVAQAREPMGMAKREHIAAIASMPMVAKAWRSAFDRDFSEQDIDALYAEFLPLQKSILNEYSEMIDGAADAVNRCRSLGLKIGSSTGYTRELMEVVSAAAKQQGYEPDIVLCAEDAPRGRPAPYLLWEAAKRLDVYPMYNVVKVDDTPVGVEAGRNAGCWTIGVTRTGNCVGLSKLELEQITAPELRQLCDQAAVKLTASGAQFIVESIVEVPALLLQIEARIASGQRPE